MCQIVTLVVSLLFPLIAITSARKQDRDGDHPAGGTEPHPAPAGAAPGVQRCQAPRGHPPAEKHRQK